MCSTTKTEKVAHSSTTNMKILMDMMETLKLITNSSEAHLYMMVKDKLYRVIRGHCTAYPTGWKPGLGTIVAAHVAFTKNFFTSNNGADKEMFKYGVGRKGADADKILAIPIADPKGKIIGVLELSRFKSRPPYEQEELDMAICIAAWASSAIYRNATKTVIMKDDLMLDDFLFSLEKYGSYSLSFTTYLTLAIEYVQRNIGATGAIYSEIIKTDPYLVVDYYRKHKDSPRLERSNKKRCLTDKLDSESIYCLKTADIYRRTEIHITEEEPDIIMYESVLYCPVFEHKRPAGIAIFWKRDAKGGFTWYDELVTSNSLSSLVIAYNIHRISQRNFMKKIMCSNIFDMVIYHLRPCKHDSMQITKIMNNQSQFPDNFFKFSYYNEKDSRLELLRYSVDMFRLLLGSSFLQLNPRLGEFVHMVANSYRKMPYHNFRHAFTTMHSMFNIILRNKDKLFPFEVISLMVATICHDMDHPGFSNAFLKLIDSYMWQLYEEPPILEYHHSYFALYIIQYCELFTYMKKDLYKLIVQNVKEHILATDLTTHFKIKADMLEMLSESGFQWADPEHREAFKSILMTTCDLSVCFKTPQDAVGIIGTLYAEFYAQGDQEKKRGVVPLHTMDRSTVQFIPNGQVSFLTMICMPCFELVKEIVPNCDEIFNFASKLLDFWKKQAEDKINRVNIVIPEIILGPH